MCQGACLMPPKWVLGGSAPAKMNPNEASLHLIPFSIWLFSSFIHVILSSAPAPTLRATYFPLRFM